MQPIPGRAVTTLAIEHVEGSVPAAFRLTRFPDGKSLSSVALPSPYEFPVEGRPSSQLMRELRWYLEGFLDYPFHPATIRADHVLDALKAWGSQCFNALFDRRDAGAWLAASSVLRIHADDPHVLSWPWEALYDAQAGSFIAHQHRLERRLNQVPDPAPLADVPNERVNILLVVARPYDDDVSYRSIARPLVELIQSRNLPAHVDVLRPPTFDRLREHLRTRRGYYHVLHFDGHGAYGDVGGRHSLYQFRARQGCLIFENDNGEPDPKSAHDLSALLRDCAVPAVVLNACQSAMLDEQAEDAFSSVATSLLRSGMRSVVAMAYSLYVSGAQVFLPAFYRSLFESGSVAEAALAGRQQMLAHKARISARGPYPLEDWLLPVVYQQDPLNFDFARQARLDARESRLPEEVLACREEYGFIGRDVSILKMERALHRRAPCILVHGLGGVGKTTLARGFLRWLDETGGLDRALWFDFRDIRTAEYILNRTGELYGEDFGAAPNKLELLARAMSEHRVIIVWDNFESADANLPGEDRAQLGRFLDAIRGTRSKVIITSRSHEEWLTPSRRIEIRLVGLEGEERWDYCEAILRELDLKVNRDDPDLNELMNQLAGHPLAMRVVLPMLEKMSARKVVEALRTNIAALGLSDKEEHGRLFATLRFVEQGLSRELQPMMSLLALHEGYVDANHLEAMAAQVDAKWTRHRIDRLIAALGAAGLVRDIGQQSVYEIHPLLISYLRSRGPIPETWQRAFVDVMARFADSLAVRPPHEQRIPFLLHAANLYSALHVSKRSMDRDLRALTQSLAIWALYSRSFTESSRLYIDLARHATALGNGELEAAAYHQLGKIAYEQRQLETAREWLLKSLAINEKLGKLYATATTFRQLGMIADEQREFETARDWYGRALAITETEGNSIDNAWTYYHLGVLAQKQQELESAREWYLKALAITEKLDFPQTRAGIYHQLGMIAQHRQEFETAREWYLKSLAISESLGDLLGAAATHHQLGRVAQDQWDLQTARECFIKYLGAAEKENDTHGVAQACQALATVAATEGSLEESARWLARAISGFRSTSDLHYIEMNVENFFRLYENAQPGDRRKLKNIWMEAGLGPFSGGTEIMNEGE